MAHLWTVLAAAARPDAMLHEQSGVRRSLTFPRLLEEAENTAAALVERLGRGTPRPHIGILMANSEPWVRGLFATLRIDAAAVPLPLPVAFGGVDAYAEHLRRISAAAGLSAILVDGSVGDRVQQRVAESLVGLPLIDIAHVRADPDGVAGLGPVGLGGDAPAVIQFTSGSTRTPKGVALSHHNVLAGLDAIAAGCGWRDEERLGLWLPLFHDMGLFSMLAAFTRGSSVHLWRPGDFIRRPMRWLAEFSATGCTAMPAPNFCYDLLVAEAAIGVPRDLDLSNWHIAANGAEPVRAATVARFLETFAPYGLQAEVMRPMYGMAEATLPVTMRGTEPSRTLHIDRASLTAGTAVRAAAPSAESERAVVSCGRPVHNIRMRVGAAAGTVAPDGVVGEIQILGPAVTSGYLGLSEQDQPFTPDGWLLTGDLGFVDGGELFVVGRSKDMITVRGANYYAEDVEEIARTTPGFGRSRCAAFAWAEDGRERIVVLWESDDPDGEAAVAAAMLRHITEQLGTDLVEILPVPRSSIPYTTSGKVKRGDARKLAAALTARPGAGPDPVPAGAAADHPAQSSQGDS